MSYESQCERMLPSRHNRIIKANQVCRMIDKVQDSLIFDYFVKELSVRAEPCRTFYWRWDLYIVKISDRNDVIRIFPKYLATGQKFGKTVITRKERLEGGQKIRLIPNRRLNGLTHWWIDQKSSPILVSYLVELNR
jgi:hypothetical protein